MKFEIEVELLSDTTFARGDGTGGEVDTEVEYDVTTGLPFVRGRVLKGLLTEECANILFALQLSGVTIESEMKVAAQQLFGRAGSTWQDDGALHIGTARLPADLVDAVRVAVQLDKLEPAAVLASLTDVRRQTSIGDDGLPEQGSLRGARVVLRGVKFTAPLQIAEQEDRAMALLAACVKAVRRGGLGRNRGRGRLQLRLLRFEKNATNATDVTDTYFKRFEVLLKGGR